MLHVLLWYLAVQLVGLAALPMTLLLFRNLFDRGYAFARPLGLLLLAYTLWLGTSFGFLRNEGVTVVVLLLALAGLSVWTWSRYGTVPPSSFGRREREQAVSSVEEAAPLTGLPALREFVRQQRRSIITTEVLFLGGLLLAAILRSYSPDIATAGGEKYMEFAFINSILRSGTFPPPDPWLSGYAISYYYLGYVILAMLMKLSSVPAEVGFNLSLALLFALTLTGAFSILYNLTPRRAADPKAPPATEGSVRFGLLGSLFVAVLGNLEGFLEVLHSAGIGGAAFWAWLDIKEINGPSEAVSWMPSRFIWWWRASRVITDRVPGGGINEVIDEFPSFSFILGDNHPHVLALPFVLLAVALAINVLRQPPGVGAPSIRSRAFWLPRLVPALLLGALGFLNSWDFPTYTAVYVIAYAIQSWLTQGHRGWTWLFDVLQTGGAVALLGLALYIPFWAGLQSQAHGLALQTVVKTRLPQYLVMFGPFVLLALAFLAVRLRRWWNRRRETEAMLPLFYVAAVALPVLVVMMYRGWWTAALLDIMISAAIAELLLTAKDKGQVAGGEVEPATSGVKYRVPAAGLQNPTLHTLFALGLFALGLGLTLATEFVFIRDNFGSRMNTVFKFYFQAWILLGLASAYAAWWLLQRLRPHGGARVAQQVFGAVLAVSLAMALVYPVLAAYSRSDGFRHAATLDGTAWVAQQHPDDYAAIQWLRTHVEGQPTILEAPGDNGKSYAYEGRMSAFTGLPTVLGWGGHESQWRGNYNEPGRREPLVAQIFQTPDARQAQQVVDQFHIDYVVYGSAERERYGARGAQVTKFEKFMDPVFRKGDTVIYQRR